MVHLFRHLGNPGDNRDALEEGRGSEFRNQRVSISAPAPVVISCLLEMG